MVRKLRAALIVGAGVVAYKALTKEKILTDENIKNGTIGALTGMYVVPRLENLVKEGSPSAKRITRDTLIGSGGGAVLGYLLSKARNSDYS